MPTICEGCTEVANTNYTLRTGDVYICRNGVTRSLGNVTVVDFTFRPEIVEHRSGKDGSLDAIIPLREDFELVLTVDEITPANLAFVLGVDPIEAVDGCIIPLKAPDCDREYSVQFVHTFPCGDHTLVIDIWRAMILAEFTLQFGESIANFPIRVRAKKCASAHPEAPYGQMLFNVECPAS